MKHKLNAVDLDTLFSHLSHPVLEVIVLDIVARGMLEVALHVATDEEESAELEHKRPQVIQEYLDDQGRVKLPPDNIQQHRTAFRELSRVLQLNLPEQPAWVDYCCSLDEDRVEVHFEGEQGFVLTGIRQDVLREYGVRGKRAERQTLALTDDEKYTFDYHRKADQFFAQTLAKNFRFGVAFALP